MRTNDLDLLSLDPHPLNLEELSELEEYVEPSRADDGVVSLAEIGAPQPLIRLSTGFADLNWVFDGGMPKGAVSLLAGQQGTGKSRLLVSICRHLVAKNHKVLYVQAEVSLEQFKSWVGNCANPGNFLVSTERDFDQILFAIHCKKPDFVVIDSLNMLEGMTRPTIIRKVMDQLNQISEDNNCHIVLIGHMDKSGKIKGNTDIPHLADMVVQVFKGRRGLSDKKSYADVFPNEFEVEVTKSRFGPTGRRALFVHKAHGVEECSIEGIPLDVLNNYGIYTRKDKRQKMGDGYVLKPQYNQISIDSEEEEEDYESALVANTTFGAIGNGIASVGLFGLLWKWMKS
jgi:predicted ATP-dependent serine protease